MHKESVGMAAQAWKGLAVLCAAGMMVLASIQPVMAQGDACEGKKEVPVQGKIHNNAIGSGTTLGTVHLRIGGKKKGTVLKCGLLGQNQAALGEEGITFLHTFVCDDEVPVTAMDKVHSQLTVYTTGEGDFEICPASFPPGSVSGSFTEMSTPVPGSGRGVFQDLGADEGVLHIDGTINCFGAIDMKFDGWVCLQQP